MARAVLTAALAVLIPVGIGAQAPGRFATEFTASWGGYQHGNPLDEWGYAAQVTVRQTLWSALFIEGEWSRVEARWPITFPEPDASQSGGLGQDYLSLGAGLQWPTLSVVRPYAGVAVGRMYNEYGSLSAPSYFVGASFSAWWRLRPRVEYRRRHELTSANYPYPNSSQFLVGISLLLGVE